MKQKNFIFKGWQLLYVPYYAFGSLPITNTLNDVIHVQSWTKVLVYFAFLGCFSIHTGPTLPLTPQTILDACIQNFFRDSTLYRVGEGELQEHFENDAVLRGSREMTEKYAYCSTVPRTFVQDCLNHGFGGKNLFSSFFLCFLGILETSRWSHATITTFETIF